MFNVAIVQSMHPIRAEHDQFERLRSTFSIVFEKSCIGDPGLNY
jgi:hypothetical protein